jgi:hypothetical protein
MTAASVLGAVRPDEWNLPLFIHILGALTLIGATTLAAVSLAGAWRDGSVALTRLGFRALLWAGLPSWILMFVGAQLIADKEGLQDADVTWINLGYMASEPTLVLGIIATVLSGLALRSAGGADAPNVKVRIATGLVTVALLAYLVALWAMTTKPV